MSSPFTKDDGPLTFPGDTPLEHPIDVPAEVPPNVPTDPPVPAPSDLPATDDRDGVPIERPPLEPGQRPQELTTAEV